MIKVALLSKWHVHADEYAGYAMNHPEVSIVKVWDEDKDRGEMWAKKLGVDFVRDVQEVFQDPNVDAVIIASPTSMHKELMIGAANAKKHIFTEKVMAFTVKDCLEIYQAVEENGVKLTVSLPRLTESFYVYVEDAIKSGLMGKVNTIRCKVAHDGALPNKNNPKGWLPDYFFDEALTGGGAFVDFGAHPIYMANRIGKDVKSVISNFSQYTNRLVDDHAVVVVEYQSGMIGILEASFVTRGCPFIFEVFGTEGTIMVIDGKVNIRSVHLNDGRWVEPKLPERLQMPFNQWINTILNIAEPTLLKEDVIRLTEVNELAKKSHIENKRVFKQKKGE